MKKDEFQYFVMSSYCETCKHQTIHCFKKDSEEIEKKVRIVYYLQLCLKCWRSGVERPAMLCKIEKAEWLRFVLANEN